LTVTYHTNLIQGSDEWLAQRCGMLTASNMGLILTPTLKQASNDKERQHLYELLAQRVTKYVEPHYISDDMLRGKDEEYDARDLYSAKYAPVTECGFITNDKFGFTIGCSPDGLVGEKGLVEFKSRRMKYQAQTIIEGILPIEFSLQVQSELLISERSWCDFGSYCGGMPMFVLKVFPDPVIHAAITQAAIAFHERMEEKLQTYELVAAKLHPTERRIEQEITV
jgi:hypothetical protein